MIDALDWNLLRVVLACARARSVGGAAKVLAVNGATVSRRLDAVEEALAVKLFERTARGLVLTDGGRLVVERAERVEAEIRGLERAAQGTRDRVAGRVVVTAPPTMAQETVAPLLAELAGVHEELELVLREQIGVVSLERGEADVAVRVVRPEHQRLVARKVGVIHYALAATPAYLERHGRELGDGEGHVVITYVEEGAPPESAWLAQRLPKARVAMRTASARSQLVAARQGVGLALVPATMLRGLEPLEEAEVGREVWVVSHEESRSNPAVRAVVQHLAARLSEWLS
ncbi:MAG: LysR family transcriptional regulator [Sandaracinus sp.]|nr:LysR family transcriptional regulator [Sandaracinus sp.]MCB9625538.1 LysR family transcriptional regulator [Sandaracinus sp.]